MNTEKIAKICHDANKSYCESIGDNSQPSWENAPDWQKQSEIKGVNYLLKNPYSDPSSSHSCWLEEKISEGWKFGEIKDIEKKEHPAILMYDALPPEQQAKNCLFFAIAKSLLFFCDDSEGFEVADLNKADNTTNETEIEEKDFQFVAIINKQIAKPLISASSKEEAYLKFEEQNPFCTVIECNLVE